MVFGCCYREPPIVREIKLVCIGIDGDGKTTVLKFLKGEDQSMVTSTNGFTKVNMTFNDTFDIIVYDLGGGAKIRDIWENYYAEVHGAVFVIDPNGPRKDEAFDCIRRFLVHKDMYGKPVLFVQNKIVDGRIDEIDFAEQGDLHEISARQNQHCFTTHCNVLTHKNGFAKKAKTIEELTATVELPLHIQFCVFVRKIIENYVEIQKGVLAAEIKLKQRQDAAREDRRRRLMQLEHDQRKKEGQGVREAAPAQSAADLGSIQPSMLSDEVFTEEPAPTPSVPKNKVAPINGVSNTKTSNTCLQEAPAFNVPTRNQQLSNGDGTVRSTLREKPRLQRIREELERRQKEAAQSSNGSSLPQ